jgi:hypothetical protein
MSRELRELLGELDAYGPSEAVYHLATERARALTKTSDSRLPKVGRVFAIGVALAAVTVCIVLLALAAHSRSTLPPAKAPTTPAKPLTQAELDVFMNTLRPRLVALQTDIRVARSELADYRANPTTTTGMVLGTRMVHTSEAIDADYASLTAVAAPRALEPTWSQFTHLVQNASTVIGAMGNTLRTDDVRDARRGTQHYINQTGQPITRLKAALVRYAATAHLRLPAWIDKPGPGT